MQSRKSGTYTRSSLGLFLGSGDGMGGGGGSAATSPRSPGPQRSATVMGTTTPLPSPLPENSPGEAAGGEQRRRAARRQSEDTMRAMRSLDRQYGRRRRLNSDHPRGAGVGAGSGAGAGGGDSGGEAAVADGSSQRSTYVSSRARQPLRRGDSRALFAPLCLPHAETVLAVNVSPSYAPPPPPQADAPLVAAGGGGGSARLARQLMQLAGRLAQQQGPALDGAQVRPRASMPTIGGGAHRPLQRNRSQVARRTRDELADALTMKAVEIRGGRIVLDDPSSSDDEGSSAESSASSVGGGADDGASSVCERWEDALRRRWHARRCLAARVPFASAHRLAQAEHDALVLAPGDGAPRINNGVRRVLASARATCDGAAVDVLLCSDAVVVCAPPGGRAPVPRVLEFGAGGGGLALRLGAGDRTVLVGGVALEFAAPGSARPWVESAVLAQARQDVPPPPSARRLLLARGRSSIAGSSAVGNSSSLAGGSAGAGGTPAAAADALVRWVPDRDTLVCMVCHKTAFSMMVRRHHCRACGLIICYRCSAVDGDRHRRCVRCSASAATAAGPGAMPPSLHTLGRRAAEYLPSGDVVMQMAAQREASSASASADTATSSELQAMPPLVRRKNDRLLARRPISTLFASEENPTTTTTG
ncbi:hypothetical protein GGF42_007504 [Coemansia sp. RSA 2424]|nr:hypothetical protein GGF42_007504 [Coemansia sp. RSA 2424]